MNTPAVLARLQSVVALGTHAVTALRGRFEALPGFGFSETMAGTIRLGNDPDGPDGPDGPDRRVIFRLRAAVPQLASYLRDGRTEVAGEISIDGLAQAAPITGSLWIWPHRSIIRYAFSFHAADGQELVFSGQKDIRLFDFRRTITTLPAELKTAAGEPLGHAVVYFALADLPSFVRSFHPVSPSGYAESDAHDVAMNDSGDVPGACPAPTCHP